MDKTVLVEYADMKEEIKDLRRRIEADRKAISSLKNTTVSDSVACGKKGKKPLRTVKINGRPTAAITRKELAYKSKITLLEELEIDLLEKQTQVEEYIQQIKKSRLRTMFRFYYMDDLTWEMVAMKMNLTFPNKRIPFTNESCRKLHDRFLGKSFEMSADVRL